MHDPRPEKSTTQIPQVKKSNERLMRDFALGILLALAVMFSLIQHFSAEASGKQVFFGGIDHVSVPDLVDYASKGKSEDEWYLVLVNSENALPSDYQVDLATLQDGSQVDQRCVTDLQQMLDDCRAAGNEPVICSSYRSQETQEQLFTEKVAQLKGQGYSEKDAYEEADRSVAFPGTSEHQIGLAVDIVDARNQQLTDEQEQTPTQQWLIENSWRYGFILRYPSDKTAITGKIYEPWHYRYVGKGSAESLHKQKKCLEEYV